MFPKMVWWALGLIRRKALNSEMSCSQAGLQRREESRWHFVHVPGGAVGLCSGCRPPCPLWPHLTPALIPACTLLLLRCWSRNGSQADRNTLPVRWLRKSQQQLEGIAPFFFSDRKETSLHANLRLPTTTIHHQSPSTPKLDDMHLV